MPSAITSNVRFDRKASASDVLARKELGPGVIAIWFDQGIEDQNTLLALTQNSCANSIRILSIQGWDKPSFDLLPALTSLSDFNLSTTSSQLCVESVISGPVCFGLTLKEQSRELDLEKWKTLKQLALVIGNENSLPPTLRLPESLQEVVLSGAASTQGVILRPKIELEAIPRLPILDSLEFCRCEVVGEKGEGFPSVRNLIIRDSVFPFQWLPDLFPGISTLKLATSFDSQALWQALPKLSRLRDLQMTELDAAGASLARQIQSNCKNLQLYATRASANPFEVIELSSEGKWVRINTR